tara:strand:+ start:563 stop:1858 length:1296 start_codon:yes stop_codon:yes gene_type:complete
MLDVPVRNLHIFTTIFVLLFFGSFITNTHADEKSLHLGVKTCSATTCHGAVEPWQNSVVAQNEYLIWSKHGSHSKAYKTLKGKHARVIGQRLGIGSPEKSKTCLVCHTDYVPEKLQGENYSKADGVGCEACHGGAEFWIGEHVSGLSSRAKLVSFGMNPTEDPVKRAELCLSCHQSNSQKKVTHQMMGAGHPRLSFELDTYTINQPSHARIDFDYRQRKSVTDSAQLWAIGQAISSREQMKYLSKAMRDKTRLFPELTLFECGSCHHSFERKRWRLQPGVGLGPGEPLLYDASLLMLRITVNALELKYNLRLKEQIRTLHRSTRTGSKSVANAADDLVETIRLIIKEISIKPLKRGSLNKVLKMITSDEFILEYADYSSAEQATMAVASLLESLNSPKVQNLNKLYQTVESISDFRPQLFAKTIAQFSADN